MNTELKEVSPTEREIKIEIAPDKARDAYNKISQRYAKAASVPGFRKGYAPLDVIRMRYKDEIRSEVLQLLLPDQITAAIDEHKLAPLTEPHVHLENQDTVKVNGSEPIVLHVHFEIMPEVPSPDYKNLEIVRRTRPVKDEEIEEVIENRRTESAVLMPVEGRKSAEGDTVIADLVGTFADEPDAEPITVDNLEIPLGDEVIEKAFTENLIGVEEDEEKEFTINYPAEFSSPALAGKTVNYKAKIKSVGKVETPALDDEWVTSLDEEDTKTVADFRKNVRADMEKFAVSDAEAALRVEAINKLVEKNKFAIPNAMIDAQARSLLNNFARDLSSRGVDLNQVGKEIIESAYNQMRVQAERDVMGSMLLEKIAELENVEVSELEVNEEIEKMASYYQATPEEIRESIEKQNGENAIENNLRTRKAIEAVVSNAKISDGEWVNPQQPQLEEITGEGAPESEENEAESAEESTEENAAAKSGKKSAAKEKKPAKEKKSDDEKASEETEKETKKAKKTTKKKDSE